MNSRELLNELTRSNSIQKMYVNFEAWQKQNLYYSDLQEKVQPFYNGRVNIPVFISIYCQFGDYDNSCMVERSNVEYLKEYCQENNVKAYIVTGGYGSTAIAFDLKTLQDNPELVELLYGLEDYPVIDEELMSNMEHEAILENLNDYGLEEIYDKIKLADSFYCDLTDTEKESFDSKVNDIVNDGTGLAYIEAGGIAYIDTDRVAEKYLEVN